MKLLIIDVIGLHTGFLGCYGNEWVVTPTLDSLAADGVVFDNHIADLPLLTNAGASSARTGQWGGTGALDVVNLFAERGWVTERVTPESLEEFLPSVRAATRRWKKTKSALIWVDGPSLVPPWSLPQAALETYFEEEAEEDKGEDEESSPPLKPWPDPPQGKHTLSENDWHRLRDTYAGVVTYFDSRLEELCNSLVERELADDLTLCVTARSGLPLGEHGMIGEGPGPLHGERVHIPLIVRFPVEDYAGRRVRALTQPVDLLPSLMEVCFNESVACDGRSFMSLLRHEAREVRAFAASRTVEGHFGYLRTKEAALCLQGAANGVNGVDDAHSDLPPTSRAALYLKPEDRWEINDTSKARMEQAEEMERMLREWIGQRPSSVGPVT